LTDLASGCPTKGISLPYRYDDDNNLRVAEPVTFAIATDAAFNQIRRYSTSDVAVTIRLLEAIAVIAAYTRNNKGPRGAASCRHDLLRQPRGVGGWIDWMWVALPGVHGKTLLKDHNTSPNRT